MAGKLVKKDRRFLAKLVTENRAPCAFCHRDVDNEATYGKLYAIGDIQCHYFCALLSCCLVQKAPEEEGLFGFLYKDILTEIERSKKHKCSYCGRCGANLGCSVGSCRKQFHLPCGRERNAVSLFYGSYKSFCKAHAPRQKIPDHIMCKAKLRMKGDNKNIIKDDNTEEDMVCVICYESVKAYPTVDTFWPPCCARDAWFHRTCLQRMALAAGMHYLKCPLCNDKENFYEAVVSQGYYVPDRDAAWELEQNAFAEIYERPVTCSAEPCLCPSGREHDEQGMWDIKLCLLCGSVGVHAHCMGLSEARYVCLTCTPAAPENMQALADTIDKLIIQEQALAASSHGPVMPSRMSLRRTKRIANINRPSTSGTTYKIKTENQTPDQTPNTRLSRQDLNLKSPRKLIQIDSNKSYKSPEKSSKQKESYKMESPLKDSDSYKIVLKHSDSYKNLDAKLLSPMKMLEDSFREKIVCMGGKMDDNIVGLLKNKFKKPKPLSEKRKILDEILNEMFSHPNNVKIKEPVREWSSPRKCYDITEEEIPSENQSTPTENIVENSIQETPKKDRDDEENEERSILHDDSSNSTFQLPSEFIANDESNDSFTPKGKTIDMIDSSLEISEQEQTVNIDVVKMNDSDAVKCSFKFSRLDKEKLEEDNVGIDLESFKKGYLTEVVRNQREINRSIDFNVDAHVGNAKSKKRKLSEGSIVLKYDKNEAKRRKMSENDLNISRSSDDFDIKDFKKTISNIDKKSVSQKDRVRKRTREGKRLDKISLRDINKLNNDNKGEDKKKFAKREEKRNKHLKEHNEKREKKYDSKLDGERKLIRSKDIFKTEKLLEDKNVKRKENKEKNILDKETRFRSKIRSNDQENGKDKRKERRDLKRKNTEKKHKRNSMKHTTDKNIKVTIDSSENKLKKKTKTKLSITNNDNISVKIKWRQKQLRLKIESKKDRTVEKDNSKLKQYVLQYFSEATPKEVLVKPEKEVSPLRKKYVKQEKTPDNLKQMSIQNFFKVKSPKE